MSKLRSALALAPATPRRTSRALAVLGHSPIVLTPAFDTLPMRKTLDGRQLIHVPARPRRGCRSKVLEMASYVVPAALALPRLLRRAKPETAVVFFSMPCRPLGLLAKRLAGTPYLISLRRGDVPGTEPGLRHVYALLVPQRRLAPRMARAVVANSAGSQFLCKCAYGIQPTVVPNGFDTEFFRPAPACGQRLLAFLFVDRFQRQKNRAFRLGAFSALRRNRTAPFRATFVGDGLLRGEVERQCTAEGLEGIVGWHGWRDTQRWLAHHQSAGCSVDPSLYEGMPNTVLEAMACGLDDPAEAAAAMARRPASPNLALEMGRPARAQAASVVSRK